LYFFSGTVVAFRLGVTAGAGVALAVAVAGMMSKERGARSDAAMEEVCTT
jgi:hypothetical protein